MDCSSAGEKPIRQTCDAFLELGPQSYTSSQELPILKVLDIESVPQLPVSVFAVVPSEHSPRDSNTSVHLSVPTTVLRILILPIRFQCAEPSIRRMPCGPPSKRKSGIAVAIHRVTRRITSEREVMTAHNDINRRAFLSGGASLVATGASFMMLPKGYATLDGEAGAQPVLVQGGHYTDDEMKQCIQLCRGCHAMCTQKIAHCLKLGGRHAAPDHIRLMID
jgi:hypothetical protein